MWYSIGDLAGLQVKQLYLIYWVYPKERKIQT